MKKDGALYEKRSHLSARARFLFTRNLVRDLLSFPAFADCELALMDTDPERLERITAAVRKINAAMGTHATITPTQSRAEALSGADGVLCTVFNGGIDVLAL